jgi:hypothetical protein
LVFTETIGKANCSELRTKQLDGRFEIGGYLGKTLLIGADVSAGFLNESAAYRLKALTGGDLLMAEHKNSNRRMSLAGILKKTEQALAWNSSVERKISPLGG